MWIEVYLFWKQIDASSSMMMDDEIVYTYMWLRFEQEKLRRKKKFDYDKLFKYIDI
jgi:hypothetical protein